MTIKELKAIMADLPDHLLVMVNGYEGGLNDVTEVNRTFAKLNIYEFELSNFGPHEEAKEGVEVIIIQ